MNYLDYIICYSIIFLFGSAIGSFLNVVIYRLPLGKNLAIGRSNCPQCEHIINWYDLVPIVSYIGLRGKCRNCNAHISLRYPLVEVFTGVIAVVTLAIKGISVLSLFVFLYAAILIAIAVIDWDTMTIPDSLNIAIVICAIIMIILRGEVNMFSLVGGFFIVSVPMLLLAMAIPGAFGGGDIKMMAASGLILGFANTIVAAFIGIVIGGMYAIYLMKTKDVDRKSHMAFGPYLCMGCYIAMLYGDTIIQWYLGFF